MSKSKYLNETGLSQLVTLMQEDTDNRIELALENVVHAGNNPEDSGEILLVNADTLDGHTADYFATAESVDELRAEVESGSGNQVPEGVTYVDGTESEDAELLLVDADTLGGNAADYYASKTYVAEQVADANHLTREIVTEIPTVDTAKDNVIYMYKVESATGNDVYQEYQLINGEVVMVGDTSVDLSGYVKNETVENIVNGTTVVAEATKSTFDGEGNKISETYATQENVDKIQTVSSEYIGTSGWYRIAEYKGINLDDIKGMHGNSCSLMIKRDFVNHSTEVHRLQLTSTYNYQEFVSTNSCAPNQVITKARYTYDATKFIAYIELYYSADYSNACYFEITHPSDCHRCWQAIAPTPTEETVEGVTVTTTYDIPANAKPVTTVDDTNLTGWTELTEGFDLNNAFGKYRTALDAITATLLNLPVAWTSGELTVEWIPFVSTNTYGVQKLTHKYSTNVAVYYRVKHIDNWGGWEELATTADLANYLPLIENGATIIKAQNTYNRAIDLQSGVSNASYVGFRDNIATFLGALGFHGVDTPVAIINGVAKTLLHTGNKPTGTYTGNGSATQRTISTGGIGKALLVIGYNSTGQNTSVIVTPTGVFGSYNGSVSASGYVVFNNGVYTLATADSALNANGGIYTYQVL